MRCPFTPSFSYVSKILSRVFLARVFLVWLSLFPLCVYPGISPAASLPQVVYETMVRAETLIEQGTPAQALKVLNPYLASETPAEYVLALGATARMETGDMDGAKALWERAVSLYPDRAYLKYNLAMTAFRMEDYDGAVLWLARVLEGPESEGVNPDQCRYYLALAFYSKGDPARAEQAILPISSGSKAQTEWICLEFYARFGQKKWTQAEHSLVRLIKREPDNLTYWRHYRDVALSRQHLGEAAALQEILLTLDALRPVSRLNRDQEEQRLAQWYRHLDALPEQVRLAEQTDRVTLDTIGRMLALGQPEKALAGLETLEKDQGVSVASCWLKGRALFALGRSGQAVSALVAARTNPLSREGQQGLGPKEIRKKKDDLVSRCLLLAGQICWLDHEWVRARQIFRQLAVQPGQAANARVLIDCIQALLDETRAAGRGETIGVF